LLIEITKISDFASNPTEKTVRVGIVEDRGKIHEGLARLIAQTEGFECSGTYRSMEETLSKLPENLPDILLSDIGLPRMNGIEGIKILKEKYPNLLVLMLSVYDDNSRIIEAICAGASGYLLKNTSTAKLIASIKEVLSGGAPMSPEIARRVMELFRQNPPPKQVDYDLTPHEPRLLKMLVEGHNYKTAAATLGLSVNTISFHMRHIYEKLQVHSKSEAVAKVLKNRIVGRVRFSV
jgi:DNA-binding NarL/FixJ family response regulator